MILIMLFSFYSQRTAGEYGKCFKNVLHTFYHINLFLKKLKNALLGLELVGSNTLFKDFLLP